MQILDVDQVRAWDEYTILNEPISSIDLMERAASACFHWLMLNCVDDNEFTIYCGKGNNGGDGLAIARLLARKGFIVKVYILEFGTLGTDDFQANLARLHQTTAEVFFISTTETIHTIDRKAIVIDSLFGSGLNKPLSGLSAALTTHINDAPNTVISIDIPSGLFADKSSWTFPVVRADHTLSFQCYKPAFMVSENASALGEIHILDIGLLERYLGEVSPKFLLSNQSILKKWWRRRGSFTHKGNYGHCGLIAGSKGMMGAAVLSAIACLRTGAGKLTCHVPGVGYSIMQTSVPEAMCAATESEDLLSGMIDVTKYDAIGIGPGIQTATVTKDLLSQIISQTRKTMVLDADALNILAGDKELLAQLPPYSILTPHPKEFDRLFGESENDFERLNLAIEKANYFELIIVLKGRFTFIAIPGAPGYFNTTGNAGLAKGGSGDVLTGMILALLGQGYPPQQAAVLGVYLHGLSADRAIEHIAMESLFPSDLFNYIGDAITFLY
ncbi:MAG: NAD(P)H-hydrate dehydratase [Chitinophagaceae bacterium]|nr:NAD(P)H-hydrate dehydratase [Chitinophagaceae bacterium]